MYANLEIRIFEQQAGGYPLELTLDGRQQFQGGYLATDRLPWVATADPEADGVRLFNWLFGSEPVSRAWAEIRGRHPQRRLRLRLEAGAPELHALPWELLLDPSDKKRLAADAATPFSRYPAGNWPPGDPLVERPLKLLAAIANPDNLAEYGLAPVQVEAEQALIETAVSGAGAELLAVTFMEEPVTLAGLETALAGGCHLLHLVSHGRFNSQKEKAALALADEDNELRWIKEHELAGMLGRLPQPPRLIFLAGCQSATQSPTEAWRGLAPQLIRAGVPVVLAMQDLVPVETVRHFTGLFYRELLSHGQVDLAANQARSSLLSAAKSGSQVPVLFSRLVDNRLWAAPEPDQPVSGQTSYQASLSGTGAIAQGPGSQATTGTGPGITIGSVGGNVYLNDKDEA